MASENGTQPANRISSLTPAECADVAKRIGKATDDLNRALVEAYRGDVSVTIEIVDRKWHGMPGLELVETHAFDPIDMDRSSETGSTVERALGGR